MNRCRAVLVFLPLGVSVLGAGCLAGSATPPTLTVSDDDSTVKGGLGTYCWTRGGLGGSGECGDTFAIITTNSPLVVQDEPFLHGELHGEEIARVEVKAYPVGGSDGATSKQRRSGDMVWMPGRAEINLRATIDGSQFKIDISPLTAAPYLISVTCYVDGRGDANYGFLLDWAFPGA
jgi:hypothetical protein